MTDKVPSYHWFPKEHGAAPTSHRAEELPVQVLMMVFDILASHHKMTVWHDASLDQQMAALAKLRDAKRACHVRIRTQHSLKKCLSADIVMALTDQDNATPVHELIGSTVSDEIFTAAATSGLKAV